MPDSIKQLIAYFDMRGNICKSISLRMFLTHSYARIFHSNADGLHIVFNILNIPGGLLLFRKKKKKYGLYHCAQRLIRHFAVHRSYRNY